jgi:hypothetical protein
VIKGLAMPGPHHVDHVNGLPTSQMITITTVGGHRVVLDDHAGTITITHSSGSTVKLTNTGVEVQANAEVSVAAPMVRVDSAMTQFSGVVKCDALITNSVVSSSYTPGAGNVW